MEEIINYDLIRNVEACYFNIPHIVYYSHIGTAVIAFVVGAYVFLNNRKSLLAKILFSLTVFFSLWTILDLVTWIHKDGTMIMFAWATLISMDMLVYVLSFYLLYVFLFKKDLGWSLKGLLMLAVAPTIVLASTTLNLEYFDASTCNAIDGFIAESYLYTVELVIFLAMLGLFATYLIRTRDNRADKQQGFFFGLSLLFFLGIFLSANSLASYYDTNPFLWSLTQYGLFGMTIFVAVLGYLIVKFHAFNIKLLGAQALVVALVSVVGTMFLFAETTANYTLIGINLILVSFGGILLIKSVKKEVEQREQLEELTNKLEAANERLKELDKLKSEFVSIASHQLRSPLTAIRGYASLIIDGTYGKIPQKAMEAIERISESAKNMAYSIEDYLNVSRIESGNMKYNKADFNLRDEAEKIADDLRPQAIQKGLGLIFRTDLKSQGVINADIGKVIQIIQNLINNAIKYTPQGSIKVLVRDDVVRKKIYIDIEDTGVGIPQASIDHLFGKFERATNANSANIHGTGLGLFVAHQMATQMGGNITAQSEGEGKGSVFTIEFPLAM